MKVTVTAREQVFLVEKNSAAPVSLLRTCLVAAMHSGPMGCL